MGPASAWNSFGTTGPYRRVFANWLADTLRRHRVELAHSHEFIMAVYRGMGVEASGAAHLFTMHGVATTPVGGNVALRFGPRAR